MPGRSVCVVGTGAFATTSCESIARHAPPGTMVRVLGRRAVSARSTAYLAASQASIAGTGVSFAAEDGDLTDPVRTAQAIARARPDVVINCTSFYRPSDADRAESGWSALNRRGGFGVTVALQGALLYELGQELLRVGSPVPVFNACYPDAVNPLLAAAGLPIVAGLGNAAAIHRAVRRAVDGSPRVLAAHLHMHAPESAQDEAQVWVDGTRYPAVAQALAPFRALPRSGRNQLAADETGPVLAAFLGGPPVETSLSGPSGLPGGYPVRVSAGAVEVILDAGVTQQQALAWNQAMGRLEGIELEADGSARFTPPAQAALEPFLPGLTSFRAADLAGIAHELRRQIPS